MKTLLPNLIAATVLAATATSANAQTIGTAANYDIFVMNDGKIELKDSNQLYGHVGYSDGSDAIKSETMQNFVGSVYVHTGANFNPGSGFTPSGGIFTSGYDGILDQVNADLAAYASHLDSLVSDFNYTSKLQNAFSLTSTKALTVVDFTEIDMVDTNFTLTGRAGQADQVIIRVSNQLAFDGVDINLTNLDQRDVIWYYTNNGNFDLHRGGNNFFGTILAPDGAVILGEANFTGAVYGADLKLGSGFKFEGNTVVPEPSSVLMLFFGGGSLLMIRRRKR